MNVTTVRRRRLEQLLDLAQAYRSCSRKDLAQALGRDPTKLVPGTGIPKLDLVVELAGVLDWPIGEVAGFLWNHHAPAAADGADFDALNGEAGCAHRRGDYRRMLELADRAWRAAASSDQRARAANRLAGAWDGLGRYTEVLAATKKGLAERGVAPEFRRMLESNLANAYYSLWSLVESGAIARQLLEWYAASEPCTTIDRKTEAFAHYVAGHTFRRRISREPKRARELAALAAPHLERAAERYERLASELGDPSLAGIAATCRGGLIETEVELGRCSPAEALAALSARLDSAGRDGGGDRLESCGWWCIFGCNIAMRHLEDERELQRCMAVLTNKADEIADRLDNWSMRERVFAMQYARWERALMNTGFDIPCVIDADDVRVIAGTMGRFPCFRETGWRILQSARVIDRN